LEGTERLYHANAFELIKSEALPLYTYEAKIVPNPVNRPQFYQILGILAKRIMYAERKPVVSVDGYIESLPDSVSHLQDNTVKVEDVGDFTVNLAQINETRIGLNQFEHYARLVNRLADIALTLYSNDYYKFHPKAPFILKDEPYFDDDLIEKTGILDSKSYYRGLMKLGEKAVFVLNRETQLRSNRNLLVELKSLAKLYEEMHDKEIDFYNPPDEFVSYVNFLLKGKAAEVAHSCYPGPSVRRIGGITWKYRAGERIPGINGTPLEYLQNTYGITGLDSQQPLVFYEIEHNAKTQYHVPEVLSVGHTFKDLRRRIPGWQRTQVWGSVHPDCKNQLHKIYDVLVEIDKTLRARIPEVYPGLLEISTDAIDVSSLVSQPLEIELCFGNKSIKVKPPYDIEFYRHYSNKKIRFAKPLADLKMLVCAEKITPKLKRFLGALASEYLLRNNSNLSYDYGSLKPEENNFETCQMVLTIGEEETDDGVYRWYKENLQNKFGIIHQHVTLDKADENSVMQLIMQISLKMGGEPWLIPKAAEIPYIVGINSYLNPISNRSDISILLLDGEGHLLEQFDPMEQAKLEKAEELLKRLNEKYKRVLFLTSFDRFGLIERLEKTLAESPKHNEYCIVQVVDNSSFRFFETYLPRKAPRFGKAAIDVAKCPIEAYENAPQGVILRSSEKCFYLLTGKTIEKEALKRGCPTPIRMEILKARGKNWEMHDVANRVLALCMMGRASGHMTRFPMPLYYLQLRNHYVNEFGVPQDDKIRQKIFYV
jgi:hypothetical protein